jgi:hypothetical protein
VLIIFVHVEAMLCYNCSSTTRSVTGNYQIQHLLLPWFVLKHVVSPEIFGARESLIAVARNAPEESPYSILVNQQVTFEIIDILENVAAKVAF